MNKIKKYSNNYKYNKKKIMKTKKHNINLITK